LALNSGEWFFRFFILDHFSHHAIHLNNWFEIPRPPLFPMGSSRRRLLNQSTRLRVSNSISSIVFYELRRRMTSVL